MTIYVITHKQFKYADELSSGYTPMMVGANFNPNHQNYLTDNTGENISDKNKEYCELTGLYWIWKNSRSKNVGLAHYRRFFYNKSIGGRYNMYAYQFIMGNKIKPVTENKLEEILKNYDWIVAHPENEGKDKNLWEQFIRDNYEKDLINTRDSIEKLYPNYISAFNKVMYRRGTLMSPYNMFYTSKRNVDLYCEWLFNILFDVEQKTDMKGYTEYQRRLYGFLSERLLNVWLCKNANYKVKYLTVFKTDDLNRKNILKKFF